MNDNKKGILTAIFRIALITVGGLLMIESVIAYGARSFNLGIIMPFIIGLPLVVLGALYPIITMFFRSCVFGRIIKWCFIAAYAGFCALFAITTATILINSRAPKSSNYDAIIVLGAGTNGREPTLQLRFRLEKAAECFNSSSDAYIIVSGGMGTDESDTEAAVMKNWLTRNGIPSDRVIEEGESSSTEENMLFSKRIIDALVESGKLGAEPTVVFVTSRFHVFRAERLAKRLGVNAEGIASREYKRFLLNDYMRECAAIVQHFVLGKL
ncbi:MAG: YdcF family protein [Clostridia bacterium]|nr:YdcF family protein [Clostridia bacterium]